MRRGGWPRAEDVGNGAGGPLAGLHGGDGGHWRGQGRAPEEELPPDHGVEAATVEGDGGRALTVKAGGGGAARRRLGTAGRPARLGGTILGRAAATGQGKIISTWTLPLGQS